MRYLAALLLLLIATPTEAARFLPLLSIVVAEIESQPQPAPPPTGECTNCSGTGRLGDGTVFVPCPACGGDGRIESESAGGAAAQSAASLDAPPALTRSAATAVRGRWVVQKICRGRRCELRRVWVVY